MASVTSQLTLMGSHTHTHTHTQKQCLTTNSEEIYREIKTNFLMNKQGQTHTSRISVFLNKEVGLQLSITDNLSLNTLNIEEKHLTLLDILLTIPLLFPHCL